MNLIKEFIVDDFVMVQGKKIKLNLNVYRNLHFQVNNKAKKIFAQQLLNDYPELKTIRAKFLDISYIVNANDNRKFDLMNVVSIVDKFFLDALVEIGVIEDDNSNVVTYNKIKKCVFNKNNKNKKISIICDFFD